jgi:hypothetical protein
MKCSNKHKYRHTSKWKGYKRLNKRKALKAANFHLSHTSLNFVPLNHKV